MLGFYSEDMLVPAHHQAGGPSLVRCLQLLTWYICRYPPLTVWGHIMLQ